MPPIKKLEHEDKNALITLVCDSSTATEQNRHYLDTLSILLSKSSIMRQLGPLKTLRPFKVETYALINCTLVRDILLTTGKTPIKRKE